MAERQSITKIVFSYYSNQRKLIKIYFIFTLPWVILCFRAFKSYWSGDDWPNSQAPYWILWRFGELNFGRVLEEALYWNREWMEGQGRFYPLHFIESRFAFSYLRELSDYKLLASTVLFLSGISFVFLVFRLTKSHFIVLSTLLALAITVSFRRSFDPHLAFAFMVPGVVLKCNLSFILYHYALTDKRTIRRIIYLVFSILFYSLALLTYEYGFLLFPVFIFILLTITKNSFGQHHEKNRNIETLKLLTYSFPILCVWLAYACYVFLYLRPAAKAISGAYVLGISKHSVTTLIEQIVASIPLLSFKEGVDLDPNNFSRVAITVFVTLLIANHVVFQGQIFDALRAKTNRIYANSKTIQTITQSNQYSKFLIITIAIIYVISAPTMLSIQVQWWTMSSLQNTYLGIYISELGFALLLGLLIAQVFRKNLTKNLNPLSK